MSSAQQSHLTAYGYDMVVATTQKALNATMLQYLDESNKIEATVKCWVWRKIEDPATKKKTNILAEIALDELTKLASGVNPFDIDPNADPDEDVNLQKLRSIGFNCAFSITPGLPQGILPQNMPDIIELENESSSVKYHMLCSELKVCAITYMGMDVSWTSVSQPAGSSFGFTCKVDLRTDTNSTSAFTKLDPTIQDTIRAEFGSEDAFSVQQLLFDLENAGLESVPTMEIFRGESSIDPIAKGVIDGNFLSSYFADMHERGQPLLHVAVVSKEKDKSDFRATDMTKEVCQLLDDSTGKPVPNATKEQKNMSTLNYLCMSDFHRMPPAQLFTWNWMTEAESHQYDGVISYSRNGFADLLKAQLEPKVLSNCYIAEAKCWLDALLPQYACGFKGLDGHIINPQNRDDIRNDLEKQSASPQFTMAEPGNAEGKVMEWSWKQDPASYDQAGSLPLGYMKLQPSYDCQVRLVGNQILITQHVVIWLEIMKSQNTNSGNIVDRTINETITLKADDHGRLVASMEENRRDDSQTPGSNGFMNLFNKINDEIEMIQQCAKLSTSNFEPAPISIVQKFQFPGGKTFAFRDFQFSKYQDLTAGITYVDPVPSG